MIICICHNVSDKTIKSIIAKNEGIEHVKDLKKYITICNQCGKCKDDIKKIIKHSVHQREEKDK